ncbi:unnamed protein product [Ectocarpus sp. CCAP 1310/34]|nr:unnamed protein product [Ectocarpus sp. CCAP 1310/34]
MVQQNGRRGRESRSFGAHSICGKAVEHQDGRETVGQDCRRHSTMDRPRDGAGGGGRRTCLMLAVFC